MSIRAALPVVVLMMLSTAISAGCGGKPMLFKPAGPVTANVSLAAGEALNPDAAGRPSPVFLRVYVLRDAAPFMTADFDTLVTSDEALLAAVLLHSQTLTLRPGEQRLLELQLDPAAHALAAVAEFRDPNNSTWRASVTLTSKAMEKKGPVRVSLRVDSMQVQMKLGD